jgi:hypothetical protein
MDENAIENKSDRRVIVLNEEIIADTLASCW